MKSDDYINLIGDIVFNHGYELKNGYKEYFNSDDTYCKNILLWIEIFRLIRLVAWPQYNWELFADTYQDKLIPKINNIKSVKVLKLYLNHQFK